MKNYFISLDRNHIPIHPKVLIENQDQYNKHIGVLQYLHKELELGFQPNKMITLHLKHPSERSKLIKETNNPYGFKDRIGYTSYGDLWKQVPEYKYYEKRRIEEDDTTKDIGKVKNLILKYLYGIKRPNQNWKYDIPNMIFFLEKGKVKLQYHIHLLIDDTNALSRNLQDQNEIMNTSVKERARCISKRNKVHIRQIDDPHKVISYLSKEIKGNHYSLDFINSNLIQNENTAAKAT
jgi:hypothetical protein